MPSLAAAMMTPFTIVGAVKVTLNSGSTDEALTSAERYAERPKASIVNLLRLLSLLNGCPAATNHSKWGRTKLAIGERLARKLGGRVAEWVFGGIFGQLDGAAVGGNNGGGRPRRRRGGQGDDRDGGDEAEGEENGEDEAEEEEGGEDEAEEEEGGEDEAEEEEEDGDDESAEEEEEEEEEEEDDDE